jgi:hypothetical protein
MFFVLASILAVATPLAIIVNSLRNAPEGYQDDKGFHVLPAKRPSSAILRGRLQEHRGSQAAAPDVAMNLRLRPATGSVKH